MFDTGIFSDELRALKVDVSRLLNTASEEICEKSKNQADELADHIKAAMTELGDTLSEEDGRLREIIAERPVAVLASAFALGIVVGLLLKRS